MAQHPTAQRSIVFNRNRKADRDLEVAWIPGDEVLGLLRAIWEDEEARTRAMMRGSAAEIYVVQMGELIARVDSTLALLQME